ncbi:amino acid ABC transporter substrate-binding protein [Wenjunlia vitaminophila]|uniref:Amino acid ABC transporter substrate-binding protein n=1 Tax=Wenjunlia vitaminophila TaxID=76728 RepID=A0A0T6LNW4_WENVI|nr:ectoine/hydroxyectoine ABC transporter substrate-binding protein EhuB [Wenjunlia vitaminophila]KRV47786.1 amino acid ABC transporter substrate-binding protein [Wenjunlia vitaminophila]
MRPGIGNDIQPNIRLPQRRTLLRGGALAASALGGLVMGCSRVSTADATHGGNLLEQLRDRGSVRLGIAGEIPFAYINKQGKLTGEAPTVAGAVFERLGVRRVQAVPTEFGNLIPGLKAGLFDVIAAGMYINRDRCAEVLFSEPDYQVTEALIVRRGNPGNLRDYQDVARAGATLGVASGGAEIGFAKEAGVKKISVYRDQLSGFEALRAGRMDAFTAVSITARLLVRDGGHDDVELTPPFLPVINGKRQISGGGYAFRPGQTRIVAAFNRELLAMRESGELLSLARPFGFTEKEMTTLTTKQLCAIG